MKSRLALIVAAILLFEQPVFATASGDSAGTGTSVNNSSTAAQGQNSSGSSAAAMAGAMYAAMSAAEFSQCNGTNPGACALGALFAGMSILSMLQSKEHAAKAADAGVTAADTNAYGDTTTSGLADASGAGMGSADIAKLQSGVGGNMANYATGKITTADGKTYDAADMSSPASMAAAGFSPDQIAQAMSVAGKIDDKVSDKLKLGALTATNGYDEGGGGGGAGGPGNSSGDGAGALTGAPLGKLDRGPAANVAGMTKNFNGEPIGVAGDSIFEMMNRRYKLKDKQNAFIDGTDPLSQQK